MNTITLTTHDAKKPIDVNVDRIDAIEELTTANGGTRIYLCGCTLAVAENIDEVRKVCKHAKKGK